MSKRKKFISLLGAILLFAVILMVGYWIAKSESNTLIRMESDVLWATLQASPSPQPSTLQRTIRFSIRSDKSCYVVHEPVEIWTELVNISDEPITVMKAIHIFTGGSLYGLDPLVNGQPNKRLISVFDEGEPSDDYATLLPNEGVLTRIPDFLYLIDDLDGQSRDSGTGRFDFALQYKNWIPNVLNDFVFTGDRFLHEVYGDRPVWTSILESNPVTVTIVDNPAQCSATATPAPSARW